jgi:hypothetical protein
MQLKKAQYRESRHTLKHEMSQINSKLLPWITGIIRGSKLLFARAILQK